MRLKDAKLEEMGKPGARIGRPQGLDAQVYEETKFITDLKQNEILSIKGQFFKKRKIMLLLQI